MPQLKDTLRKFGWKLSPEKFYARVLKCFTDYYANDYTDEDLLFRPKIAQSFVNEVNLRLPAGARALPPQTILRALVATRKRGMRPANLKKRRKSYGRP